MKKTFAIILAASICIWYGMERGETVHIFKKAVNICLECIGLG